MFNWIKKLGNNTATTTDNMNNTHFMQSPISNPYSVQLPYERDPRTMGIDVQEDIEKIKATWRGMRLSDDGSKWIPVKDAIIMISESGAEQLLGLHQQMLSIPNATTNLDEEKINMIVINYGDNLNELICGNYHNLKIPKSYFDFVIDPLTNSLYMFLLKSLNDKQRMFDSRSPIFNNQPSQPQQYPQQLQP